jgi:hypothetical protein
MQFKGKAWLGQRIGGQMCCRLAAKSAKPIQFRSLKRSLMLFYLPFCNLLPKKRKSALGASFYSC